MPVRAMYYPMARSAHIERLADSQSTILYYRDTRGDWDLNLSPAGKTVRLSSTVRVAARVLRGEFDVLEIPEPLAVRLAPDLLVLSAVWRITPKHSRPRFVTYAIENREQADKVGRLVRSPRLGQILLRSHLRFVVPTLDKLAFGTEGSRNVYIQECGTKLWKKHSRKLQTRLFEALPRAEVDRVDKQDNSVLFIGTFEGRKGFPDLMECWAEVVKRIPGATLLIVCPTEPADASVVEWVRSTTSVTVEINPSRARIRGYLERSSILVLPSRRTATWREQVGLPIVEALSYGCTIVTSAETGIESWLRQNGHQVIRSDFDKTDLVNAIAGALSSPLDPARVLGSLPLQDQRAAADEWLFASNRGVIGVCGEA